MLRCWRRILRLLVGMLVPGLDWAGLCRLDVIHTGHSLKKYNTFPPDLGYMSPASSPILRSYQTLHASKWIIVDWLSFLSWWVILGEKGVFEVVFGYANWASAKSVHPPLFEHETAHVASWY